MPFMGIRINDLEETWGISDDIIKLLGVGDEMRIVYLFL